jgi:hypothetical protein
VAFFIRDGYQKIDTNGLGIYEGLVFEIQKFSLCTPFNSIPTAPL